MTSYQFLSTTCGGLYIGAVLMSLSGDNSWLPLIFIALSLAFSILDGKVNTKEKQNLMAEKVDAFRYRGLYPPKGEGSDEDVKRLKEIGEKGLALRLYLELHPMPLKEAHRAFKAL